MHPDPGDRVVNKIEIPAFIGLIYRKVTYSKQCIHQYARGQVSWRGKQSRNRILGEQHTQLNGKYQNSPD